MKRPPLGVLEEGMLDHHRPPVATSSYDERLLATDADGGRMRTMSELGSGGTLECRERTGVKTVEARRCGGGGEQTAKP